MDFAVIFTLLAGIFVFAETKTTIRPTRHFSFNSSNPSTVVIGLDLYTVSYYDTDLLTNPPEKREVYLNITSSDEDYKPCKITLDVNLETIADSIKASSIWRKIVVWGVRSNDVSENFITTNYTFLLVNPRICRYKTLKNITDSIAVESRFTDPELVVYQDKIDIFYASQTVCSPCKFDINGDKIDTKQQLKPETSLKIERYYVRTIGKSHNYVVVNIPKYSGELMKLNLLDRNFKHIKSVQFDIFSPVMAINSVENGPYVGIISIRILNSGENTYTVLDNNFNIAFEAYLPLLDDYWIEEAYANIDSVGNSCVTLIQSRFYQDRMITMLRYDINGRLIDEIVVGKADNEFSIDYVKQPVLIAEREYCLVIHMNYVYTGNSTTNITCFDVSGRV